jgi:anti-repressor protein
MSEIRFQKVPSIKYGNYRFLIEDGEPRVMLADVCARLRVDEAEVLKKVPQHLIRSFPSDTAGVFTKDGSPVRTLTPEGILYLLNLVKDAADYRNYFRVICEGMRKAKAGHASLPSTGVPSVVPQTPQEGACAETDTITVDIEQFAPLRIVNENGKLFYVCRDVVTGTGGRWVGQKTISHVPSEFVKYAKVKSSTGSIYAFVFTGQGLMAYLRDVQCGHEYLQGLKDNGVAPEVASSVELVVPTPVQTQTAVPVVQPAPAKSPTKSPGVEVQASLSKRKELPKIFEHEKFGQLRIVDQNGEPWFVAADVCQALDLGNPRSSIALLDDDEKGVHTMDTPGGKQEISIISESGLYSLVLRSRKPEAKKFKRWITHEVLPSIRKHGAYIVSDVLENMLKDPDTAIRLFSALKEERAKVAALTVKTALLEKQIENDKPAVQVGKAIKETVNGILVGEMARILFSYGIKIGSNRLFEYLRANGYLISGGRLHNRPRQWALDRGLFTVKPGTHEGGDGKPVLHTTTLITAKGREHLISAFRKKMGANSNWFKLSGIE